MWNQWTKVIRPIASISIFVMFAGCAFDDGLPVGELRAYATAAFSPSAARLDSKGRLITSQDYAIQIDAFELTYDALVGRMQQGPAISTATFDPANPPPQYSLCHNGHCHHEDGRLVDYDEIALELMSTGEGSADRLVSFYGGEALAVDSDAKTIAFRPCAPHGCPVEAGRLLSVELVLSRATLQGRVFDRRTGDDARLPPEGLALQLDLLGSAVFSTAVSVDFNENTSLGAELRVHHEISEKLFDRVDFQTELEGRQLTAAGRESLFNQMREEDTLEVTIRRYNRD